MRRLRFGLLATGIVAVSMMNPGLVPRPFSVEIRFLVSITVHSVLGRSEISHELRLPGGTVRRVATHQTWSLGGWGLAGHRRCNAPVSVCVSE